MDCRLLHNLARILRFLRFLRVVVTRKQLALSAAEVTLRTACVTARNDCKSYTEGCPLAGEPVPLVPCLREIVIERWQQKAVRCSELGRCTGPAGSEVQIVDFAASVRMTPAVD